MKREFVPFWKWEDWKAGMWSEAAADINLAIEFTGDYQRYGQAMREVIFAWPNTMANSLTNPSINRRAFIGHCACCYKLGLPEYIVRKAWKELTQEQRDLADNEAENAYKLWKENYANTLKHGSKDATHTEFQTSLQKVL